MNTVAFEGFGAGYLGNETSRGVALAPQAMTDTLVDNGPNPATTAQSFTLTDTITSPGSIYVPTGTLTLEYFNGTTNVVVPTTGGTLSNGTATLTVAAGALSAGTYNLFVVYSGDTYHQTQNSSTVSQVVNSSQATTTTTLTDNGPNPSAVNQPVSFTVSVTGTSSINGETVQIEDASNSNAVVASGVLSYSGSTGTAIISISSLTVGAHNLFAVYAGDSNNQSSLSNQVTQTVNNTLIVLTTQQTNSGIIINFNQPVNPNTVTEYAATVNTSGASSATGGIAVSLTNGGSPVLGSLVFSNSNATVYFIKTGVGATGLLPTGTNTLSLLSGTSGFQTPGGVALTGTYQTSYTVSSTSTPVVSVPDFARGPGEVDATGFPFASGLPVGITNGSGLTTATVTMTYNPADFNVSAVTTPLTGYSISGLTINNTSGTVTFTVSGGAALASGAATLADIQYTIPTNAVYGAKEALRLTVTSNIAVLADDAVHVVAYAGDVNAGGGSGSTLSQAAVTAQDASVALGDASASAGGIDNAFSKYVQADPKILAFGDTIGASAVVNAQDASNIINEASRASGSETQLPFTPTGVTPVAEAGNDPELFFSNYSVLAGQTVTIAVNMTVTETSGLNFQSADINFTYNSALLTNPSNIRVGGLDSGYLVSSNTQTAGQIYIGLATSNNILANGTTGTIALIDLTVASNATIGQSSPLVLVPMLGEAPTEVNGNPSNVSPYPTGMTNQSINGVVTVTNATANLAFQATTSVSAGAQFTVPVNLTATTPFNFQSMDLNIVYNSSVLTLVGTPTLGTLSSGYLISTNTSTAGQAYVGKATSNNMLAAGTTGSVALFTFNVASNATGSTYLAITTTLGGAPTEIDGGMVTLSPAPTTATNVTGVDGVVNIVIQPDQPPFDSLPVASALPSVLFNPAALPGLRTAAANKEVFSGANGDAIKVTDSDYQPTGPAETTTVTLTGSLVSSGAVGTLTSTASGAATLSGNGTTTLTISGSPTDITNTLNGLIYQPGPGYYGTTTLTVSTDDNGNSGYGGPLIDTRSTAVNVVGLFISEVMLGTNTPNSSQYVEIFSTSPSYTIPANVYLIGVNGNDDNAINDYAGQLTDTFNLGGDTTGSNGYLAFLEKGNSYVGSTVSAGLVDTNAGSGVGFGTGSTSSSFSGTSTVHKGVANSGADDYGNSTDLQQGSITYLLLQTTTSQYVTPTVGQIIDTGANGTSGIPNGVPGGPEYNSWNVLDGVGILRNQVGTYGPDTRTRPSRSRLRGIPTEPRSAVPTWYRPAAGPRRTSAALARTRASRRPTGWPACRRARGRAPSLGRTARSSPGSR